MPSAGLQRSNKVQVCSTSVVKENNYTRQDENTCEYYCFQVMSCIHVATQLTL